MFSHTEQPLITSQTFLTICNIFQIQRQTTLVRKEQYGSIEISEGHSKLIIREQFPGITSRFPLAPLRGLRTTFYYEIC